MSSFHLRSDAVQSQDTMASEIKRPESKDRPAASASLAAAINVLRLHQWIKNVLVFAPLVLGGKASHLDIWRDALIGFTAFGLTASGTYIINDICDREHDRHHALKSSRPIASGALSMSVAVMLSTICILTGLALGYRLELAAFYLLLLYVSLTLAYSLRLRSLPVVDVVTIAGLFTLRLAFGTALAGVRWSPWLLVLSMATFLSLALAKRFAEVSASSEGDETIAGRGYMSRDLPFIRSFGVASATAGVLTMVIYLINEAFSRQVYAHPQALWAVPIILLLNFSRIWLTAERGDLTGDPVTFALTDKDCIFYGAMLLVVFFVALAA